MYKVAQYLLFTLSLLSLSMTAATQERLSDSANQTLGLRFMVHTQAPYIVLLPGRECAETHLYTLAKKLNNLKANVLTVTPSEKCNNPHATPEELLSHLLRVLAELKTITDAPLLLMGEERSAAVALMAATHDFRIKGVIAASPGEYFSERELVQKTLKTLRAPVLALYSADELPIVKTLLSNVPDRLIIKSGTLNEGGYSTLLLEGKESGAAWLATSIFYNELFGEITAKLPH